MGLLKVLNGEACDIPPMWLMRQAGRYLPEYREVRKQAATFLDLCYTPAMAAEVTLQPIRRFGFDAAILFADILVVPDALGQQVRFLEGEGPKLDPLADGKAIAKLDPAAAKNTFAHVYETVSRVVAELPANVPLIGFCGAPWTVATYMIAGHGTPDQMPARLWAYRDPVSFKALMYLLVDVSAEYLSGQISAGARAVQIFDSWAAVLPEEEFRQWVIEPTKSLVAKLRARHGDVPIIGFPRGAGYNYPAYVRETGVNGVGCDTTLPVTAMRDVLAPSVAVQGNLDPIALLAGGEALETAVRHLTSTLAGKPHIFNLGHGILPQTPIAHVEKLVALVRERR